MFTKIPPDFLENLQSLLDQLIKSKDYQEASKIASEIRAALKLVNLTADILQNNDFTKLDGLLSGLLKAIDNHVQSQILTDISNLVRTSKSIHDLFEHTKTGMKFKPGNVISTTSTVLDVLDQYIDSDELTLAKDSVKTVEHVQNLYKNLKRVAGGPVIPKGTMLKCTCGSIQTPIQPTHCLGSPVQLNGKEVATVEDSKGGVNILPFGTCSITGNPCVPATTGPWLGIPGVTIASAPTLTVFSYICCSTGGTITPTVFQQIVQAGTWIDSIAGVPKEVLNLVNDAKKIEADIKRLKEDK